MTTLTYNSSYHRVAAVSLSRKKVFWGGVLGVIALSLCYLYLIGGTVVLVVERKNIEADIRNMRGFVSALEGQYVGLSKQFDLSAASAMGYVEIKNLAHVSRASGFTMRQ